MPNKRNDERVDDGLAAVGEDHLIVPRASSVWSAPKAATRDANTSSA